MNLVILTTVSFPVGMAPTNRIISYSKGIVNLGHNVKVICLIPTEKEDGEIRNKKILGEYEGIKYEYAPGVTSWSGHGKNRITKLLLFVKGLVNSIKIIKKQNDSTGIDGLSIYTNSTFHIVFFYFVSRVLKIPYIREVSEYPNFIKRKQKDITHVIYRYFYEKYMYKLFDAMIIETKTLIKYYRPLLKKSAKILQVPMTVEPDRFIGIERKTLDTSKLITYCGNLYEEDGISILIKAFKRVCDRFDNVKLILIGDIYNNPFYTKYKTLIKMLEIKDKVIFKGRLNRNEVPVYLCNSEVLVLASPTSLRSTGSLPSKLGEYLSTGNPVVVTGVGEIPDYLKDNVNAFIATPDSVESFAEKINYVLSHYEKAKKIGLNGRKIAVEYFNYMPQSQRIIDFVTKLHD